MKFADLIDEIEAAIEPFLGQSDKASSYRARLIFHHLEFVQSAIDDWRQGGPE